MKNRLGRKVLGVFLVLVMLCGVVGSIKGIAYAAEDANNDDLSIAKKTSTQVNEDGRFGIEIQIPGENGRDYHDEVIVMIDGSYSTDQYWSTTRNAILKIGETALEGKGNTLLTIMTFGMGDNIVLKHVKSVEELNSTLTDLPGGLLYGRSSTNCEAGFTGIEEYIKSHDSTLNEVQVVYITDGQINTDESPYVFYNWTNNQWLFSEPEKVALISLEEEIEYFNNRGTVKSNAYIEVFENTEEDTVSEEDYSETVMQWADLVWKYVYEYSGMNPEEAYPVSDAERAFVKYDKEHNTHIQEMFYYSLWKRKYPDMNNRTYNAGIALAANEKVANVYLIDSNSATSWMTQITENANNVYFYESGSMSNLLATLEEVLMNLSYTPYNNVVITDYMSKWVNLDKDTIQIIDNKANKVIWTSKDGWMLSQEERPTEKENPVVVEEVLTENYTDGGNNVIGNENGTIYKITWYVKDGAMLRNHNYSLKYEVDVDTDETGFQYNNEYPANGKTTVKYEEINEEGITEKTEDIPVPNVIVNKSEPETEPEPPTEANPTEPEIEPETPTETNPTEPETEPETPTETNPTEPETEPGTPTVTNPTEPEAPTETNSTEPTNTVDTPSSVNPKTGDDSKIGYYIVMIIISSAALIKCVFNTKKKKCK